MSQLIKFYFTSSMLNMFRSLIHPSSGACDFSVASPPWLCVLVPMCVGVSVWLRNRSNFFLCNLNFSVFITTCEEQNQGEQAISCTSSNFITIRLFGYCVGDTCATINQFEVVTLSVRYEMLQGYAFSSS